MYLGARMSEYQATDDMSFVVPELVAEPSAARTMAVKAESKMNSVLKTTVSAVKAKAAERAAARKAAALEAKTATPEIKVVEKVVEVEKVVYVDRVVEKVVEVEVPMPVAVAAESESAFFADTFPADWATADEKVTAASK